MTGTATSRGKVFMDFDGYKNQEWLRRRKLRLEQVRKQSSEIAKALRQKVNDEEKRRIKEYERVRDERFRIWKCQKLEELEEKLKGALEGFGGGHKQAEEEPNSKVIMEEKMKINSSKAQERGEIAHQEELRRKKLTKEKLTCSVERKKMTRKREDLRSALVCSVPAQKQFTDVQEPCYKAGHLEEQTLPLVKKKVKRISEKHNAPIAEKKVKKAPIKNMRKRKLKPHAPKCKESGPDSCPVEEAVETVWINLDEVQSSSAGDTVKGPCRRNSKKNEKERSEGSVEFYDFSSRYYCKSFREYPHLVERISQGSEELNANELAKAEEEMEKERRRKKSEADAVRQGRGIEALRKEKVNRDYLNLMAKLEELSKKEKILKAQQRDLPSFLHMNDERLFERAKTQQRIMESKFESVYYETTTGIPQAGLPHSEPIFSPAGGGDCLEADGRFTAKLSFSASNLKYNTPVTSSFEAVSPETSRRSGQGKSRRQLLRSITRTLKEGRELRKTQLRCREWKSVGSEGEEEASGAEEEAARSGGAEASPGGTERTSRKCQESQTEDLGGVERGGELRLKSFDRGGNESLPVSTSTSYKSPPSVMRCHRLQEFLDYLEGLSEEDECCPRLKKDSIIKKKVNALLRDLLPDGGSDRSEEGGGGEGGGKGKRSDDPSLHFYIKKLLSMSRECIANLSVSSENISTPNMTEWDVKNESWASHSVGVAKSPSKGEEPTRKSSLERAEALEKSIRNWKMILQKESRKRGTESETLLNIPHSLERVGGDAKKDVKPLSLACNSKTKNKYDEITKKCSERILELSDMLDRVRKDKEKLLTSASGGSSLSLSKNGRESEKGFEVDEEDVVPVRRRTAETLKSTVIDSFINRYNLSRPKEKTVSTTAVADSQSFQDLNESLDSWPDVMDELLKREIITSPFKWSDGDLSSDLTSQDDHTEYRSRTKPSSIESVIGNFRKEIDKIKPFSECPSRPRWVTGREYEDSLPEPERETSQGESEGILMEDGQVFQEESSVDSINRCLTSLGLNWAKSFLRKNAESRAISSSSNSDGKSSRDEEEKYS